MTPRRLPDTLPGPPPAAGGPAARALPGACTSLLAAVALCCAAAVPAHADAASAYGDWSVGGGSGTVRIPLTGFPAASVSTDSTAVVAQSGTSAFLGPGTPVGRRYGSSQGRPYANIRTAAGGAPSTTTLAFAHPTAAGTFAFALGDIDADHVRVSALGRDGKPLTTAELGWQGAFNYCHSLPRPSACGRTGADTDVPVWHPATAELVGNGADTNGASGWFQPTVPLTSLTLVFSVQSGIPVYQVWTASLATRIAGRVSSTCGSPDGLTVHLLDSHGRPVRDADGAPVTATTDHQGHYAFPRLAPGDYRVATEAHGSAHAAAHAVRAVDTAAGHDADHADLALTCHPGTPGTPTPPASGNGHHHPGHHRHPGSPRPTAPAHPGTGPASRLPAGSPATPGGPQLAATGADGPPLADTGLAAAVLSATGALALGLRRRLRRR